MNQMQSSFFSPGNRGWAYATSCSGNRSKLIATLKTTYIDSYQEHKKLFAGQSFLFTFLMRHLRKYSRKAIAPSSHPSIQQGSQTDRMDCATATMLHNTPEHPGSTSHAVTTEYIPLTPVNPGHSPFNRPQHHIFRYSSLENNAVICSTYVEAQFVHKNVQ